MSKEKEYVFEVDLKFTQVMPAMNKTQAIENLKQTFEDEFNLRPEDKEIKLIEVDGKEVKK